jgi:hypothetical protein
MLGGDPAAQRESLLDKGCQYEYNPSMTWDPMYRAAGLREVDLYQHKEVDYG